MITEYEILNVILSDDYTKARKLDTLQTMRDFGEITDDQYMSVESKILDGDNKADILESAEETDRVHWISKLSMNAASDLLTLGKVQPENMLALASLPDEDFSEAIKLAVSTARKWNNDVMHAEKDLNVDIIPEVLK